MFYTFSACAYHRQYVLLFCVFKHLHKWDYGVGNVLEFLFLLNILFLRSIRVDNIGLFCIFWSTTVYSITWKYFSVYPFQNWWVFGLFPVFSITNGVTMKTVSFVRLLHVMCWPSNFSYVCHGICTVMAGGDGPILQVRKLRCREGAQFVWG